MRRYNKKAEWVDSFAVFLEGSGGYTTIQNLKHSDSFYRFVPDVLKPKLIGKSFSVSSEQSLDDYVQANLDDIVYSVVCLNSKEELLKAFPEILSNCTDRTPQIHQFFFATRYLTENVRAKNIKPRKLLNIYAKNANVKFVKIFGKVYLFDFLENGERPN